jgi:hypothetical protein
MLLPRRGQSAFKATLVSSKARNQEVNVHPRRREKKKHCSLSAETFATFASQARVEHPAQHESTSPNVCLLAGFGFKKRLS